MTGEDKAAKRAKWWAETKMDLKWAAVLLFVLVLTGPLLFHYTGLSGVFGVDGLAAPYDAWEAPTASEEDLGDVTAEIFGQDRLVVPFEILSVLLLAALIAGVVIAMRDVAPKGGR